VSRNKDTARVGW